MPFSNPALAWKRVVVVVAFLLAIHQGHPAAAFPRPSGYVNDFASVFTEDDRAYLETFLRTLERDTTAEVVVTTVTSLEGMTIEDYANRLFADWGIGKRTSDNGVLLLVAPAERRVRIEVGYGLEGSLPDGLAGEIIRTEIIPEFKQGNLRRGIGRGLDRISRVVRGDASAAAIGRDEAAASDPPPVWAIVPFFSIFIALGGFATGLGLRTRTIAPLVAGTLMTGIPLLIAAMLSPLSMTALIPLELFMVALGYRKGQSDYWKRTLRAGSPQAIGNDEPNTWIVGGTSSQSSGSSWASADSSSSGDFGGGSSGGGGASGRW
jgi:uncharacterized protein